MSAEIWNVVADEYKDIRVRIEAYSVMANYHGSHETAKKILDLFSVMKSKQMKSFVASHIHKIIGNDLRDSRRNTKFNPVLQEDGPRPFGNKKFVAIFSFFYIDVRMFLSNYQNTYTPNNNNSITISWSSGARPLRPMTALVKPRRSLF